jgi:putative DNA primase/helicase
MKASPVLVCGLPRQVRDPLLFKSVSMAKSIALAALRPTVPEGINDRAAENWESLMAIAQIAGGLWSERAHSAAVTLSLAADNDEDNFGILLLRDIAEIFETKGVERISSIHLCSSLCDIEESPWDEFNWGGLNPRKLARLLAPFEIRPSTHRINEKPQKGYLLSDFDDAFLRYLGKTVTPLQPSIDADKTESGKP